MGLVYAGKCHPYHVKNTGQQIWLCPRSVSATGTLLAVFAKQKCEKVRQSVVAG